MKNILMWFLGVLAVGIALNVPVIKIKTSIDHMTGEVTYGKETILSRIINTIGGYSYL